MKRILPSLVAIFVAVSVAFAAASYPTSVKVFTTKAQNETIQPAHMNDVQDEIVAIEQGLLNGVAHSLKPSTDGGQALGTSALRWKNLIIFLGTLTDQLAAIDIAGTWNDAADTFTAIKANITDTASAAASLLLDLQVGGASKFKVAKDGDVTVGDALSVTTTAQTGTANRFRYLQSMARVTKSATQSLTTATYAAITFDGETFDTDGLHDNVTNNARLTAAITGKYLVTCAPGFAANATGTRRAKIRKNDVTDFLEVLRSSVSAGSEESVVVTDIVNLAATDFVECFAFQDSGGALNATAGSRFMMAYIGE